MESVDVSENKRSSSHSSLPPTSPGKDVGVEPGSTIRSTDGPTTPSASRMPSHVFRTSKANQAGWSVASNESLFSIHAGSTSFSKEQMNCMSKSSEFGSSCDLLTISSPLMELPTTRLFTEMDTNGGDCNESVAEQTAADAMNDHLREQERQHKDNAAAELLPHSRTLSQLSDASHKSFAFPILEGDGNKGGSFQKGSQKQSTAPKENPGARSETPEPKDPHETPEPGAPKESLKSQSQENAGSKKWFTCFFCCPS
ncbi:hypothetical protein like AT1G74220 [Hibiscus trionum]|uniref:Uncharacterized protein n=1 Tax=Hibiscus trionum TaxID=183268 RepID=A0A9W7INZ5_HIBTR|nr:hypothetical protein like AT1G74220 [Hibiscus trionum]